MVKAFAAVMVLAGVAAAAPPRKDMGTWDCQGSKPQAVDIDPGEHVYVWRGECGGAEGWDVVIEPNDPALTTKMSYDPKTKELTLVVTNKGRAVVRVKMHVFVGFA
jgi:hypothetical protein